MTKRAKQQLKRKAKRLSNNPSNLIFINIFPYIEIIKSDKLQQMLSSNKPHSTSKLIL